MIFVIVVETGERQQSLYHPGSVIRKRGSLTVEQSQKSFMPYKACIFLSNFACGYCVILRDVL